MVVRSNPLSVGSQLTEFLFSLSPVSHRRGATRLSEGGMIRALRRLS